MSSMRLRFVVTAFNKHGDALSQHKYANEGFARCKFNRVVHNAESEGFGIHEVVLQECIGSGYCNMDKWRTPPDEQIEGYIVHSVRSLNGNATSCKSVNKNFHECYSSALVAAKGLAKRWSDKHEGLIIFKAIAHVHKGNGIQVDRLDK